MALIEDIKTYLVAQGLVEGSTGWICRLGTEPSTPNQVVTIYEQPGIAPARAFGGNASDVPRPTFQVRVRGENDQDYATPAAKIVAIAQALNKTAVTPTFEMIARDSGPLPLGLDGSNRHIFVWNFDSHNLSGF